MSTNMIKFIAVIVVLGIGIGGPLFVKIKKQYDAGIEYNASRNPTANTYIPRDVRILCNRKIEEFEKSGPKSYDEKTLEYIENCRTLLAKN